MKDEEYLAHIASAIREIKAHTAGLTQEQYQADSKTQRAVERNLSHKPGLLRHADPALELAGEAAGLHRQGSTLVDRL